MTIRLIPIRSTSSSVTNSRADQQANSRVKGMITRQSIPAASMSASFSLVVVMRLTCRLEGSTVRGCGSKVMTTEAPFSSSAAARTLRKISRCPSWTPSKLPMVATGAGSPVGILSMERTVIIGYTCTGSGSSSSSGSGAFFLAKMYATQMLISYIM